MGRESRPSHPNLPTDQLADRRVANDKWNKNTTQKRPATVKFPKGRRKLQEQEKPQGFRCCTANVEKSHRKLTDVNFEACTIKKVR